MPFLTPLVAAAIDSGDWELTEDLKYQTPAGQILKVPRGFRCDLASIPRVFQLLIPVNDRHRQAATLHDWLYHLQGHINGHDFTREQCDLIFLTAMQETGVPRWKRYSMFLAVRIGGWGAWYS